MYAEERQDAIATLVAQRGRIGVAALADTFGVTTETVRRDLAALERLGLLRRVHGGAVPTSALTVMELGVSERHGTRAADKERIARAALELVPPSGGSVLIDAGTTTGRMARLLPTDRDLVVVTNAVPVAARWRGCRACACSCWAAGCEAPPRPRWATRRCAAWVSCESTWPFSAPMRSRRITG